jgi:predicted ribosome quality control (RQC) complex YloA/Tae2 family protein
VHNNYYFLRKLSQQLETRLKSTVVSECFTQSKEELIIRFETPGDPYFIKASLLPDFSCLCFPTKFERARKNSVDLFESLIGCRLQRVHQYENERSFALQFDNQLSLLFKMHGNRSNIMLFENNDVVQLFKNSIEIDGDLKLDALNRQIDWSYENFISHQATLQQTYFTFGKTIWKYLSANGFETKSVDEKWKAIDDIRGKLAEPTYFLTEIDSTLSLSLFPYGKILKEHHQAIEAVNDFYYTYTQSSAFTKEKQRTLSGLKAKLLNYERYYEKTFNKLTEVENDTNYKVWADLIMANLHVIKPRTEKITVENFYNNNLPIEIKLKADYTPQRNAETFYRKSKNQQIEIDRLKQALAGKDKEIAETRTKIDAIESATDLKTLRMYITTHALKPEKEKQPEPLPYHAFEFNGYKIWVGRNAQSNDKLTLKYTFKDDLWLHAKDVAGSHVVIKHQAGKKIPKDVIERAAQLAAFNSKRRNESLCPVIVTPKKFVRKRKGDPAGAMVVEREEVIMVEPMNPSALER